MSHATKRRRHFGLPAHSKFAAGILLFVALIIVSFSTKADTNAPLFAMNGWQFHEYNIPKLEEAVRRAPEYGVNFLIFSHGFYWSPEGFLASTDDLDPTNPP